MRTADTHEVRAAPGRQVAELLQARLEAVVQRLALCQRRVVLKLRLDRQLSCTSSSAFPFPHEAMSTEKTTHMPDRVAPGRRDARRVRLRLEVERRARNDIRARDGQVLLDERDERRAARLAREHARRDQARAQLELRAHRLPTRQYPARERREEEYAHRLRHGHVLVEEREPGRELLDDDGAVAGGHEVHRGLHGRLRSCIVQQRVHVDQRWALHMSRQRLGGGAQHARDIRRCARPTRPAPSRATG